MGDEITRRDAAKLVGLSVAPGLGADRSPQEPEAVPDFTGRAVLVYTRGRPLNFPTALTGCKFERQGGRLFLVGTNQPCRSWLTEWDDGATRYIAWDSVDEYVVFDSLADYHSRQGPAPSPAPEESEGDA